MKILLTGGCGYIGTNLTNTLLDLGHHVTVVDIMWFGNYLNSHKNLSVVQADIRDIEKIPMDRVDTVMHLANIANDPTGDLDPRLTWEVNALANKFLVEKAIKNLCESDLDEFGKTLDENWNLKKSLSNKISNTDIDDIYSMAKKNGAVGGKLLGAGGGGFLVFYCRKENQDGLRKVLRRLKEVEFKFVVSK